MEIKTVYSGKNVQSDSPIEYVERKGKGHPDTLIDGIVERASIEISKAYIEQFGSILHHNLDKGLIVGGNSSVTFGKGEIIRPIEIILAGRATRSYEGKNIPVDEIVKKAAADYLQENTRFLDIEKEVKYVTKIDNGSADLNSVFMRKNVVPLANDTSFGVGFAPFTETEKLSLEAEKYLNSTEYKRKMPAVGEDIKVMGIREGDKIVLMVAIAFISKFIGSIDEYKDYKEKVREDLLKFAKTITKKQVAVEINNGDSYETNAVYLTKSGLSCEAGDDGSVGRGNRANGLITPFRYMTLEAAAGKNPVNHVGKIYSVLSNDIANSIIAENNEIKECTVYIVSQIGRPINEPKNLTISMAADSKEAFEHAKKEAESIAENIISIINEFPNAIISGKYKIV
ncbi:MAG: methionine adenosyltransferase [Candidatus Micrarchaeaceae archaeon]